MVRQLKDDELRESSEESGDIIAAIEEAFASVSRGAVTLHEAEVLDVYGTDAERRDARAQDPEQDWRDVPDPSIEACSDALPHLDPVSWRFYLPAFMRLGLRRLMDPRGFTIDRAIYALDLGQDPSLFDYNLDRFRTLDSAQALVVRRFLELAARSELYCDDLVARQALERHWSAAV